MIAASQTDAKRATAYRDLLVGYRKFIGRKDYSWFCPPRVHWIHADLAVKVNPELGLEINKEKLAIKLYLKQEKMDKRRASLINLLMQSAINTSSTEIVPCLLDVRNGKSYSSEVDPTLKVLLEGEALSFRSILDKI